MSTPAAASSPRIPAQDGRAQDGRAQDDRVQEDRAPEDRAQDDRVPEDRAQDQPQVGQTLSRPVSFGVDIVPVARAAQLLDRFGSSIVQRVATGPEARWVGDSPGRLGVVLGLKEAAIKAMAGRPADFRWQQVETGLGSMVTSLDALTDRPGGLPPAVGDVLREFAAGMGLQGAQVATCRLASAASNRIAPQLAGTGEILGVGVFGADAAEPELPPTAGDQAIMRPGHDPHVYAAVCFWRDPGHE